MPDRNENIFPRKLRAANKIDAAVAAIDAHGRSMVIEPETAGVGVEVW
jgi:phage terminase large subunit-like protein